MKFRKIILLCFITGLMIKNAAAQTNANINISSANAGVVIIGDTLLLSVSVTNTGSNGIGVNKTRPSISVPSAVATAAPSDRQTGLPAGWIITNNTGANITVCNGSSPIPAGTTVAFTIKLVGVNIGGPSTIGSTLQFGPGTGVCTGSGILSGDNSADNTSQTSVTVIAAPVPLTLLSFNASLNKCQPALKWVTESEINTDRFEIESKSISNSSSWTSVATIPAKGAIAKSTYNYTDINILNNSTRVFYRLKMIDKDGSFKYSDVLPVLVECNKIQALAYPNPVQDGRLYVSLTGINGNVNGTLVSITGQVLSKSKLINGTNTLDVKNIADGTYVLNIEGDNGFSKKIKVVIHK
jgi:hypothetical protein